MWPFASLARASPLWSNAYMARVPVHCTVRANQVQEKLSHDSKSMQLQLWLQERASTNFVRE